MCEAASVRAVIAAAIPRLEWPESNGSSDPLMENVRKLLAMGSTKLVVGWANSLATLLIHAVAGAEESSSEATDPPGATEPARAGNPIPGTKQTPETRIQ